MAWTYKVYVGARCGSYVYLSAIEHFVNMALYKCYILLLLFKKRNVDANYVKACTGLVVDGKAPAGRPMETWQNALYADARLFKAKILEISSDTHQLQLIKLHHFKLEIFKSIW